MKRENVLVSEDALARQREFEAKIKEMFTAREAHPVACVDTFGCQQNVADGQKLMGMLADCGFTFTEDPKEADLVILNTCAVREHAEQRVFGNLGILTHTKKENPEQVICLCGCMAQEERVANRVKASYRHVDLVFGPHALLAGTADAEIKAKYADVIDQLPAMKELYGHRARLRKERGCMDIESGEVKLILDEDGHCIDVKKRTSGESEAMIEEFMLLANQCAAHFARVKQIPFVYRVHEEPNAEKLERLHGLLQACGVNDHFAKDVPTPKELSAILEGVRGTPYEQIINTGMLRCMSKALYEEKPKGHYGLVLKDYAHFTSPIRRYPDLAIHRIMTDMLKGTEKETMILRYTDFAERASKQSSEREVIAMQIERKAEDCYKAEYARRHLGECYEGTISGVTQRGLFIELDNGVEGFVPASSLTPSGTSLTEGVRLTDPASGKTWSLGDKMMITIVRADVNLGKIDFEVAPAAKA